MIKDDRLVKIMIKKTFIKLLIEPFNIEVTAVSLYRIDFDRVQAIFQYIYPKNQLQYLHDLPFFGYEELYFPKYEGL